MRESDVISMQEDTKITSNRNTFKSIKSFSPVDLLRGLANFFFFVAQKKKNHTQQQQKRFGNKKSWALCTSRTKTFSTFYLVLLASTSSSQSKQKYTFKIP